MRYLEQQKALKNTSSTRLLSKRRMPPSFSGSTNTASGFDAAMTLGLCDSCTAQFVRWMTRCLYLQLTTQSGSSVCQGTTGSIRPAGTSSRILKAFVSALSPVDQRIISMQVRNVKQFGLPTLDAATKSVTAPEPTAAETSTSKSEEGDQATEATAMDDKTTKTTDDSATKVSGNGLVSNDDSEDSGEIVEEIAEPHNQSATDVHNKLVAGNLNSNVQATTNLSRRRAGHGERQYPSTPLNSCCVSKAVRYDARRSTP